MLEADATLRLCPHEVATVCDAAPGGLWVLKGLVTILAVFSTLLLIGGAAALFLLYRFDAGLPDYQWLVDYEPPEVTRLYASDGSLLVEYATEKRVFVPIKAIPKRVINAFLAAEDGNFFSHPGIDLAAVLRATALNLINRGTGRRLMGASTITQQTARHFLLSHEVSIERKIREAILALRLERALGKVRILELYLNEIYLGRGVYGIITAALEYFDKSLDDLTVSEAAYLAALPKAPSNYDPRRNRKAANVRRDWVIGRMLEEGFISDEDAVAARAAPLAFRARQKNPSHDAGYFTEEVRREIAKRFGHNALYTSGLTVRATIDTRLQAIAAQALRNGLIAYDRRHGWRGPLHRIEPTSLAQREDWIAALSALSNTLALAPWSLAVVLDIDDVGVTIGVDGGARGRIPIAELEWARPWREGQRVGPPVRRASAVVQLGDVVAVEPVARGPKGQPYPSNTFGLRQIPDVNGALVVLEPHTGRVFALSGGFRFERGKDEFNRAVQAWRQPGSAFKPFVYLAALEQGYTPSTIVSDTPIALPLGRGRGFWRPANYEHDYLGPRPMRFGLERSRNVMTIRIAQQIGMDRVARLAERFGVVDAMPSELAMAIGAGETTLLRLTAAYAMLDNGGHHITPTLIDRVQDRHGRTIYRHDTRNCPRCSGIAWSGQDPPDVPLGRGERIADARSVYQIVSMLKGVVERGTGRRVRVVNRPVAGKTGTTNDSRDTWFIGFTPELVAGVYVGFDQPRTLGAHETGSSVAAPIFADFMIAALEGKPARIFPIPNGMRQVRVRLADGLPAVPGDRAVILEAFKRGTEPQQADASPDRRIPFEEKKMARKPKRVANALIDGIY